MIFSTYQEALDNESETVDPMDFTKFVLINFNQFANNIHKLDNFKIYTDESLTSVEFYLHYDEYDNLLFLEYEGTVYEEIPINIFNYFVFTLKKHEHLRIDKISEAQEFTKLMENMIHAAFVPKRNNY